MDVVEKKFVTDLKTIIDSARVYAYNTANLMQVVSNWLLGWRIVEQEQKGKLRADYGKHILEIASKELTETYGKGYSLTALKNYRKFYIEYKDFQIPALFSSQFKDSIRAIGQATVDLFNNKVHNYNFPIQLSWMHYEKLIRVVDLKARKWYMEEAAYMQWDYRTLKRNIDSQYYYRLSQTPDDKKKEVVSEMQSITVDYQKEKSSFIKNPLLVEFLGLDKNIAFTESKLEEAIISHLQVFMTELGKGFAFVARQQHIHTLDDDYYIDLVFYNYLLKCFVLIDLKTTKISYQDVGQMDMYLKMYDTYKRPEGDNPTIGIILCAETNADVAQFSTLATNKQMYASKYLTYMPTPEQLRREIEAQKELFAIQNPEL